MMFIVKNGDDTISEEFETIFEAREYVEENSDEDDYENVKLYKVETAYTVVGGKKVLFKKE